MRYILSKKYDLNFIVFPIWMPIVYFLLLYSYPSYENLIFISVMILLGETHFGATWYFFKINNVKWALSNTFYSIYLPLIIILSLIFVGIFSSINTVIFLILLFNVFHVTRQSIGVNKLYPSDYNNKKIEGLMIYSVSTIFILIGLCRFVFNLNFFEKYLIEITTIGIIIMIINSLYIYIKVEKNKLFNALSVFTGQLIWLPLLFTGKMHHAFAMGVGMHYIQYLGITVPLYFRRELKEYSNKKFINFFSKFLLYLLIYSIIMVFLSNYKFNQENLNWVYLIPIFFQTLHFYADAFIWKFSNKHVKENVLSFLFS